MTAGTGKRDADKITVTITAPGYTSGIDLPLEADAAAAFCGWFEMQLGYLARWKPGSTASIHETTPLPKSVDVNRE